MNRLHAPDALTAIQKSLAGDTSFAEWSPEYLSSNQISFAQRLFFKAILLAEGNFIVPLGY